MFSHIAWMPDETDAKKILTASPPLGELEETIRTPSYYVDEDYPAIPQIKQPLPEWSNWRGSVSSTLETDVFVWRYTLLMVIAIQEEEELKEVEPVLLLSSSVWLIYTYSSSPRDHGTPGMPWGRSVMVSKLKSLTLNVHSLTLSLVSLTPSLIPGRTTVSAALPATLVTTCNSGTTLSWVQFYCLRPGCLCTYLLTYLLTSLFVCLFVFYVYVCLFICLFVLPVRWLSVGTVLLSGVRCWADVDRCQRADSVGYWCWQR